MSLAVSLEGVSYLRKGRPLLKDIDWQVERGSQWVLLGLNGSGKTTLLNLINGYIFPSQGRVEVLGRVFGQTNIPELRTHIGWISSSLLQNIPQGDSPERIILSGKYASFGLWEKVGEEDRARAQDLLAYLGLQDFAHRPYGSLSQGERQKVMIGRALMNHPEILIFDEAFGGLDILARAQMEALLDDLAQKGQTMIFVTHATDEILPSFDQVLMLQEGQVFRQGLRKDLIQQDILEAFYGAGVDLLSHGDRFYTAMVKKS